MWCLSRRVTVGLILSSVTIAAIIYETSGGVEAFIESEDLVVGYEVSCPWTGIQDIVIEVEPGNLVTVTWPISQVVMNWVFLLSQVSSVLVVACVFVKQDTTLGSASCVVAYAVAGILGLVTKVMLYRVITFTDVRLAEDSLTTGKRSLFLTKHSNLKVVTLAFINR